MDTAAYLKRQGWRGDGHALSHTGNGIKKPLLISKKVDVLGIGLNKHAAVSDQWWMRAFDQGLKDLGTGKKGALSTVREKGVYLGGLYGRFVKGETVQGTIESHSDSSGSDSSDSDSSDSDSDSSDSDSSDSGSGEEKQLKMADKKRKSSDHADETTTASAKRVKMSKQSTFERQEKAFVEEAIRRGLLAPPVKPVTRAPLAFEQNEDVIQQVFAKAGLGTTTKAAKTDKYSRGKQERALKRAAREFYTSQQISAQDLHEPGNQMHSDRVAALQDVPNTEPRPQTKQVQKAARKALQQIEKAARKAKKKEKRMLEKQKMQDALEQQNKLAAMETSDETSPVKSNLIIRKTKKEEAKEKRKKAKDQASVKASGNAETSSQDLILISDVNGDDSLVGQATGMGEVLLELKDKEGNIRWTGTRKTEVPLDPTLWQGIEVKLLPKPVRLARKLWMKEKRGPPKEKHQTRADRKRVDRDTLAKSILSHSRRALRMGDAEQTKDIDGHEHVPLIKVGTSTGLYADGERVRARSIARKVLKMEKKKDKATAKTAKKSYRGRKN